MRQTVIFLLFLVVAGCGGRSDEPEMQSTTSSESWEFSHKYGTEISHSETVEARIALTEEGTISYGFNGDFDCELDGHGDIRLFRCKLKDGLWPGEQLLKVSLIYKASGKIIRSQTGLKVKQPAS